MHDSPDRLHSSGPAARRPNESVLGGLAVFSVLALLALGLSLASGCSKKDPAAPGGGGGGGGAAEPFDSGVFSSGVFVHTFNTPGDYSYHCTVHGISMSGSVHVAASQPDSPSVAIGNNLYSPTPVNVKTGGYVKWTGNGTNPSVTRP